MNQIPLTQCILPNFLYSEPPVEFLNWLHFSLTKSREGDLTTPQLFCFETLVSVPPIYLLRFNDDLSDSLIYNLLIHARPTYYKT